METLYTAAHLENSVGCGSGDGRNIPATSQRPDRKTSPGFEPNLSGATPFQNYGYGRVKLPGPLNAVLMTAFETFVTGCNSVVWRVNEDLAGRQGFEPR